MSKTEIDKIFKEKILEQEKSTRAYKPEHWSNFKKQLDKVLPVAKTNNYWFTLNNILFVISVLSFIVSIPILLLHSNEINKSSIIPQTISQVERSINQNIKPALTAINENCVNNNSSTPIYNSNDNTKYIEQNMVKKNESFNQGETLKEEEKEGNKEIAAVTFKNISGPETEILIKNDAQSTNDIIVQKDTINTEKNKVDKIPGNRTPTDNGKHGKKKRKNILVPTLNYNGF